MDTPASRLKSSRINRGFGSASEAARNFGWKPSSYIAHENGQNELRASVAKTYASALGVDVNWLMFGTGHDTGVSSVKTLGVVIRERRKLRRWTQAELAQQIGVSSGAVSQFESNTIKPTLAVLSELAKVFGLSADEMLAGLSVDRPTQVSNQAVTQVDPVLVAAWEKMTAKQRRKLVQMAVLLSED